MVHVYLCWDFFFFFFAEMINVYVFKEGKMLRVVSAHGLCNDKFSFYNLFMFLKKGRCNEWFWFMVCVLVRSVFQGSFPS